MMNKFKAMIEKEGHPSRGSGEAEEGYYSKRMMSEFMKVNKDEEDLGKGI